MAYAGAGNDLSLTVDEIAALRERLIAIRDKLLQTPDAGADTTDTVALDQSRVGRLSRMDALQIQAMAHATGARRRQELARVSAALRRIDKGKFGMCLECGEPVAPARLQADPAATRCIGCACAAESRGR